MGIKKVIDAERLDAALTATADAIREKTSGTDPIPWNADTGFAEAVAGITGGGAAVSVPMKDVNFYDYDGTRLYSYTVAEAAALTELPPLPTRDGLVCQGWNWTLDAIKAMGREVDVGATYITDDGKTRIYITLTEGRTSPVLGVCPNGTVTVNWGDGSEPDTLTGTSTSTVKWTPPHHYAAPGDYVIALNVNGALGLSGSSTSNEYSCILRYSETADIRNRAYLSMVRRIEIGGNVTVLNGYALSNCAYLESITIPKNVTQFASGTFTSCFALKSIVVPDSISVVPGSVFSSCRTLVCVSAPPEVTTISSAALSGVAVIRRFVIPDKVKTIAGMSFSGNNYLGHIVIPSGITAIEASTFQNCYCLKYVDFSRHTVVPELKNANAFNSIPADCEIRVPAALADAWRAATNWATYADYIVGV